MDITKDIKFIVENWDKIPASFKTDIRDDGWRGKQPNMPGVADEDHVVILLLDRQKPSVEACYDFDEERISVSKTGKVIWGFDSGCSCPSPWEDNYPDCYSMDEGWKQFELNLAKFDHNALDEVVEKINEIKAACQ